MTAELDGRPVDADAARVLALGSYGHFTAMQVRNGATRGLALHLARLDAANRELFDLSLDGDRVRARIRHALGDRTDASVRVYVFGADAGVSRQIGADVFTDSFVRTLPAAHWRMSVPVRLRLLVAARGPRELRRLPCIIR